MLWGELTSRGEAPGLSPPPPAGGSRAAAGAPGQRLGLPRWSLTGTPGLGGVCPGFSHQKRVGMIHPIPSGSRGHILGVRLTQCHPRHCRGLDTVNALLGNASPLSVHQCSQGTDSVLGTSRDGLTTHPQPLIPYLQDASCFAQDHLRGQEMEHSEPLVPGRSVLSLLVRLSAE